MSQQLLAPRVWVLRQLVCLLLMVAYLHRRIVRATRSVDPALNWLIELCIRIAYEEQLLGQPVLRADPEDERTLERYSCLEKQLKPRD